MLTDEFFAIENCDFSHSCLYFLQYYDYIYIKGVIHHHLQGVKKLVMTTILPELLPLKIMIFSEKLSCKHFDFLEYFDVIYMKGAADHHLQ